MDVSGTSYVRLLPGFIQNCDKVCKSLSDVKEVLSGIKEEKVMESDMSGYEEVRDRIHALCVARLEINKALKEKASTHQIKEIYIAPRVKCNKYNESVQPSMIVYPAKTAVDTQRAESFEKNRFISILELMSQNVLTARTQASFIFSLIPDKDYQQYVVKKELIDIVSVEKLINIVMVVSVILGMCLVVKKYG